MDILPYYNTPNSTGVQNELAGALKDTAPLTTGFVSAPEAGQQVQQEMPQAPAGAPSFGSFVKSVGTSVVHGVEDIPHLAAAGFKAIVINPIKNAADGISNFATANERLQSLNSQIDDNNAERHILTQNYSAGKINHDQYNKGLKSIQDDLKQIGDQTKQIGQETNYGAGVKLATNLAATIALPVSMWGGLAEGGIVGGVDLAETLGTVATDASEKIAPYLPSLSRAIDITSDGVQTALSKTPTLTKFLNPTPEAQSALRVGFNTLVKNPVMMNLTFQQPQQIYEAAASGKYGEAAIYTATLGLAPFAGGALGVFGKYLSKGGSMADSALFGKTGFIDEMGKYLKDNPTEYLQNASNFKNAAAQKEAIATWKVFQDYNGDHFNGDVKSAVQWIAEYQQRMMRPLGDLTSADITKDWIKFKDAMITKEALVNDGKVTMIDGTKITPDMNDRIGLAKWGRPEQLGFIAALDHMPNAAERLAAWNQMVIDGSPFTQNANLRMRITQVLSQDAGIPVTARNADEAAGQDLASLGDNAEGTTNQVGPNVSKAQQNVNPNTGAVLPATEDGSAANPDAQWKKEIMKISPGNSVQLADGSKFPAGYVPVFLKPGAKGYDTSVLENIDSLFHDGKGAEEGAISSQHPLDLVSAALDRSVAPKAIAGSVGSFFIKLGLSPKDMQAQAYVTLRRNIADQLTRNGITFSLDEKANGISDVDHVLNKLGNLTEGKNSVYDLRQLKPKAIAQALEVDQKTGQKVLSSISQGYLNIPLQIRGLGNKIQDFNTAYNPLAKPYSRIQSNLRYAFNPFFHEQEVATSDFLGQVQVGGSMSLLKQQAGAIFGKTSPQLDAVQAKLEKYGFFDGSGGRDEFADSGLVGISAHSRESQKVTMAGMVMTLADRAGQSVDDYLAANTQDISGMLRTVVQYPKNSFLNSPLMTTLNVAAFPARFNIKVAVATAKALSETSPVTQMVVLNSLVRAHGWLNSDEGIAWQTQNANALGLLKYFSPLYHLSYVANLLTGDIHGPGSFGSLGGLPFGFITNILSDEGIITTQAPYVQQSTGQVLPHYIPKTQKAAAATALNDFLASLFSYPGTEVGLESKSNVVGNFTAKIIPGASHSSPGQFEAITPTVSPDEQRQLDVAQRAAGTAPTQNLQPTSANPMSIYSIPPPDLHGKFIVQPKQPKASGASKPKPVAPIAQEGVGTPGTIL